jgi:FO synthase
MQGGIHPAYTGQTYLDICRAVKAAAPEMHIHAFSPLEVHQGAVTLGLSVPEFLLALKEAGLGTLPGTAAEVLDDEVRRIICPDKLTTDLWLSGMEAAHEAGFRTTATIMFGHVDAPEHWARHLLRLRGLQARTGGFTEFVPLPFVHQLAPIYLAGVARPGSSWEDDRRVHAIARLLLQGAIDNVQLSWVKIGLERAVTLLRGGCNDLGGTLMEETISRMAGSQHGIRQSPAALQAAAAAAGRPAAQRTTLYDRVEPARMASWS